MSDHTFRCPETACIGWVSWVEDEDDSFWGCGECGSVWTESDELNEAIDESIEKHAYRKKCYRKTKGGWKPLPLEKEPEDYEELVELEVDDLDGNDSIDDDNDEGEYPYGVDESCFRCPASRCDGWVCWTEEGGFDGDQPAWECGYCGSSWLNPSKLQKEITTITETFSYRRACYVGSKGSWKPAPICEHPEDYDDLVDAEPDSTIDDSERE